MSSLESSQCLHLFYNLSSFTIVFKVRKATADSLYTALITYDDIASEENGEEIFNILGETLW